MTTASPASDDSFGRALAGAALAALITGVATQRAEDLQAGAALGITVVASMAGFAAGRTISHGASRTANAAAALILSLLAAFIYTEAVPEPCAPEGVTCFVGGCEPFSVYAQNRYTPVGAAIRAHPLRTGAKVGGYAPNELIPVDGWVRTRAAYPSNSPPFNSDVWFHLADDQGWVGFAGVRADPTTPAPDNFDPDGGRPAPTEEACSGTIR